MHLQYFTFNAFQTQCYLAWDNDGNCAIVDPGCQTPPEFERIMTFIETNSLRPACIMLTHAHFDHIYGMSDLAKEYGISVYAGRDELFSLENTNPYVCNSYALPLPETFPMIKRISEASIPSRFETVSDGDCIEVGSLRFKVISTPGHSAGGVCFLESEEKVLFSGDTLFAGAIGRSDFPGGDYDKLIASIMEKLMTLDGETKVYPGHGPATDISTEGMTNPFLQPFNEPYED